MEDSIKNVLFESIDYFDTAKEAIKETDALRNYGYLAVGAMAMNSGTNQEG